MPPDSAPRKSKNRPGLRVVRDGIEPVTMVVSDYPVSEQVAILLAVAGTHLGGVQLKSRDSAATQQWLHKGAALRQATGLHAEISRVPVHCGFEELVGGLDIIASLTRPKTVRQSGLLVRADNGLLVLPHAGLHRRENIRALCSTLDTGFAPDTTTDLEQGSNQHKHARLTVVAVTDAGLHPSDTDDQIDAGLLDRLAFSIELEHTPDASLNFDSPYSHHSPQNVIADRVVVSAIESASTMWVDVIVEHDHVHSICAIAQSLGITSARPMVLCANVARCVAALAGRSIVNEDDLERALVLCFVWRARSLPATEQAEDDQPVQPHQPTQTDQNATPAEPTEETDNTPEDNSSKPNETEQSSAEVSVIENRLSDEEQDDSNKSSSNHDQATGPVESDTAVIPVGLLNALAANTSTLSGQSVGRSGKQIAVQQRGRLVGTERYRTGSGQKINILATLRSAAPWQKLRRQQRNCQADWQRPLVYPQDIKASRYLQATQTVTIFVVDASGSAAARRLAEAKGAIELLLAECYVRRDEVALIVFQGAAATLVLPPTRSLVRARKELAKMPAGGGTPLADGLALANILCTDVLRSGNTPVLCLLTDGRANVDRDGIGGRELAMQHALQNAENIRRSGVRSLLIDIATRPSAFARELSAAIGAQYEAMPRADATRISSAVSASTGHLSGSKASKTRRAG